MSLQDHTDTVDGDNLINGIDGIVQTNGDHNGEFGIKRWRKSIYETDLTQWDYGNHPSHNGKNVIHLSFLAPGEDLHDGSWAYDKTQWEFTSARIPGSLQGIHGGGVFTKSGGGNFYNLGGSNSISYNMGVAMEASYYTVSNTYGGTTKIRGANMFGYSSYKSKHDNQWKPWIKADGTTDAAIESFIAALTSGSGQKFKFTDDPDEIIYTIQRVESKRIYNHTPWRKMYKHDGNGGIVGTEDSVEEAATIWRETATSPAAGAYDENKAEIWMNKVVDFGKANNRRVCYIIHLEDPAPNQTFPTTPGNFDPVGGTLLNSVDTSAIEFIYEDFNLLDGSVSENPAIWETEPKDNADLDIYYETNQAYPTTTNIENVELFAPIGSEVTFINNTWATTSSTWGNSSISSPIYLQQWLSDDTFTISTIDAPGVNMNYGTLVPIPVDYIGKRVRFKSSGGGYTTGVIVEMTTTIADPLDLVFDTVKVNLNTETGLSWYNCLTFGNGIESDRIRDDFNAMTLSNGVRANATLDKAYKEEHRKSGLIYSGLYNSTNGVNNLNQFIAAEKITKDLNPTYGSIQKLFSRRISLIAFCEDRVIGIMANKNALYNADGNPQVVATNAVLGDANPFVGDFGISKNPESFVSESYRAYFTDKQRGAVLRLSKDGLTPISSAGMHDYFRDNLRTSGKLIGTYDSHKNNYNITITDYLPENLIVNGLLEEGEGESTEFFDTTDLIIDGSFTNGSNIVDPSPPTNVAENSDLYSETTITNHHEITQGSEQAEQIEKTAYNWSYGNPTGGNEIIYHADFENVVYGDAFNTAVGETTQKADAVMWQGYNGSSGSGFFGMNSNDDPHFINSDGVTSGVARIWARGQDLSGSLVHPPVSGINNISSSHLASQTNTNYFPNSINSTTFHKEEYKVTFTIQNYLNPNNPTHHSQTGGAASDNDIDVEISLWSDQSSSAGKIFNTHSDGTTSFFANGTATASTAEDYSAGWLTSSEHTFNDVPLTGGKTFSFYFMLEGEEGVHIDTSATENMLTAPIANFFNVHIKNSKSSMSENSVIVKSLKIEKIKKVTSPGNNFSQPLVPAEPPQLISAWVEVEHTDVNDWATNNSNIVLNDFAIDTYGPDTGSATTITYDTYDYSTGVVSGTDTYDIPPDPNPNSTIGYYSPYSDGVFTDPGRLEASTDGMGGNTAFLTQDITSVPLVVDNWYEVKLTGVNGTGTGVLVSDALDPNDFPTGWAVNDTLPGHLGTISDGSHKLIKFSNEGNNEWIARWQQKDTSGDLNELKIHFYDFSGTIDGIEFAEIYDTVNGVGKQTGGNANDWRLGGNDPIYHYHSPAKTIYYKNGAIKWDNGVYGNHIAQNFSDKSTPQDRAQDISNTPKVTEDGYELKFFIHDVVVPVGSLSGYVTAAERNYGTTTSPDRKSYGFEFEGLDSGGYYKVLGNFDGTTAPAIARYDSDYTTLASYQPPNLSASIKTVTTYGHMNKIVFHVPSSGSFNGRIDDVSLMDITNYFTTTNAGSWVFDGFDQTLENYIVFDDVNKNIVFTNAPSTVSLKQSIPDHDFTTGSTIQLKFDAIGITSGSISGYFYNNEGKGFAFGPINADENHDEEYVMGAVEDENGNSIPGTTDLLATQLGVSESEILRHTFVIYVDTGDFNGTLDNFELYRIYPEFTPTTISYSEDVKGWTSFKSFIPESSVNLSKEYYTIKEGSLYKHHVEQFDAITGKEINRNTFYIDEFTQSSITAVLNAEPSLIKIYNTLNYEGSQSKINLHTTKDVLDADGNTVILSNAEIYNLKAKDGWYADSITTDKQSGSIKEFIEKEGKWFNYIKGTEMTETTLPSTADLSFQGLGMVSNTIIL